MGLSNDLSCEAGSFSCCYSSPHGCFHSEVSGFISLRWSPGLRGLLLSLLFGWFICVRMWGCRVLPTALPAPFSTTLSPALLVYLCVTVGPQGLLVVRLPAPFVPHSASLSCQSWSCHSNASPLRPCCPSPPLLPVWMNVYFLSPWCRTSLLFDFLSVLVVGEGAVCLPTPPSWFSEVVAKVLDLLLTVVSSPHQ